MDTLYLIYTVHAAKYCAIWLCISNTAGKNYIVSRLALDGNVACQSLPLAKRATWRSTAQLSAFSLVIYPATFFAILTSESRLKIILASSSAFLKGYLSHQHRHWDRTLFFSNSRRITSEPLRLFSAEKYVYIRNCTLGDVPLSYLARFACWLFSEKCRKKQKWGLLFETVH